MLASWPMAVAIALSPFPVVPAVLLLFTPRPRQTAAAFLLGWALGVGGAVGAAVLLADLVQAVDSSPAWVGWARIVLGAVLVGYGVRLWLRRGARAEPPAWMGSLEGASPGRAWSLGLLLSGANPKVVLLAVAGGLAIGAADGGAAAEVGAVMLFTAVASATVAAPLLAFLVLGPGALVPLRRVRDWLERHNDAVMAVVVLAIGVLLLVEGLQGV